MRSGSGLDRAEVSRLRGLAWRLYRDVPPVRRLMMAGRPRICPFHEILRVVEPGSSVLDVGCGAGLMLTLLAASGRLGRGVGFDLDVGAIEAARSAAARVGELAEVTPAEPSLEFRRLSETEDWPAGRFDAVLVVDLLHHLRPERHAEVIRRAAATVRPGGRLVVKDVYGDTPIRPWFSRLHDLVIAGDWIWFPRGEAIIEAAESAGLTLGSRRRLDLLWYGHELLVFERASAAASMPSGAAA